jgi:hypothetical protein
MTVYENQWIHVAMTYDGSGSSSGLNLYLNGAQQLGIGTNDAGTYVAMENSLRPVWIGAGGQGGYANGIIDEVAIWNIALIEDEIEDHYLSGLEGKGYFLDPEEEIEDLFDDLQIMNLPEGTENSLLSKLDTALDCLGNGNDNAARNILNAFINSVSAQSGKKLTVAQADELITAAQDILDTI